jgi:hypothetical protein
MRQGRHIEDRIRQRHLAAKYSRINFEKERPSRIKAYRSSEARHLEITFTPSTIYCILL